MDLCDGVQFDAGTYTFHGAINIMEITDTSIPNEGEDNEEVLSHKAGRPREDRQHLGNLTNRAMLAWTHQNYGKQLTWSLVQSLIGILKSELFDSTDLARSIYLLRQAEPLFVPETDQKELELTSGRTIHYYEPEVICQLFLANPDLSANLVQEPVESDTVDQCASGEGFKRYYDHQTKIDPEHRMLLVLPGLFIDAYRQMTCRGKQVHGIEMFIANADPQARIYTTTLTGTAID